MKRKKVASPSLTIGLPTYVAGPSLIKTLDSIYAQTAFDQVKHVLVVVDGSTRIKSEVKKSIQHPKLKIVYRRTRKGQSARMNDLFQLAKTPRLILTNDDVVWAPNLIEKMLRAWRRTQADLITVKVQPLAAQNLVEWVIGVGSVLTDRISARWANYANYLACNGRCMGLSVKLYSQIQIPESVWNNDAYVYFLAQKRGARHAHQPQAVVFYRSPQTINEYRRQSHKFGSSQSELEPVLDVDLTKKYQIPLKVAVSSLIETLAGQPLQTLMFLGLNLSGHFAPHQKRRRSVGYWATDISTKRI